MLFGEPITDPGKVQERLLQAQKAILNPSKPSKSFLHDKTTPLKEGVDDAEVVKGEDEVHFSENVICIKVTSKDVRDLSVVDLPGLIANVGEKEDKRNIGLIKKLAMDTIKKEDCIILSCITMSGERGIPQWRRTDTLTELTITRGLPKPAVCDASQGG